MAHWVPFIGSGSGVDDKRSYQMLVNTFCTAFPYVYAIKGYTNIGLHLIGSMQPIDTSMEKIGVRLRASAVARDLRELDDVPVSYFAMLARRPQPQPDLLMVTDDHPLLEFYFLRTALSGGRKIVPMHSW